MTLQIMGLVFVVILLSNNAFAQTLHNRTLYEVVNQTELESEKSSQINVGSSPTAIAINNFANTVYIANSGSHTVSVINGSDNTKIGEDIIVGENPRTIAVNGLTNTTYVANYGSNSVSVINGSDSTKIGEDIIVGDRPVTIAINGLTNTTYVANYGSNSVSVINGSDNTK